VHSAITSEAAIASGGIGYGDGRHILPIEAMISSMSPDMQ
jgi:hypothetical protein